MADACEERWQTSKSTILERNMHMFNNPVMSDITFTFPDHDKQAIPAHKYVLATSSPVFFAMFYGELRETKETIEIRESDPDIFLQLLRFFYCDEVTYQDENDAIQMWYLADRYDVPSLVTKCLDFLDGAMKPLNAFDIIPHARKLNAEKLEESCWEVIDYNAKDIINDNSFSELSHELLLEFVKRSSLRIDELSLFKAVDRWAIKRCADETKAVNGASKRSLLGEDLVEHIRFQAMSPQEFSNVVITSDLLSKDEIIDVLRTLSSVSFSRRFKFSSYPRTQRDVSIDSCALGTEYGPYSRYRSYFPTPEGGYREKGVLTFMVRKFISLCGVTITRRVFFPKGESPVRLVSVSVTRGCKTLRTVKNHKYAWKGMRVTHDSRVAFNVLFNRPLMLRTNACYTIETSAEPIQNHDSLVWSLPLRHSLSDKPDSSINIQKTANKNTILSGVCSGKFTEAIPADASYVGEVQALLFTASK